MASEFRKSLDIVEKTKDFCQRKIEKWNYRAHPGDGQRPYGFGCFHE